MQGAWSGYVENDLIPRLNGFEILMASYAMAHLKLDLLLTETGYKPTIDQRFKVYLTNSLEEYHPDTGTLFSGWLSSEANEANHIKRDSPVMVVMGNPPYSAESANKGKWIMDLMDDYKKEPGGKQKLQESNPKWINDDYVKFLRYGQHYIEKNGEGILAFINPHGYLDNPTFRGMRWHLLKTYDKIYTIDLHGNSKKKETTPEGGKDENVFDIQQGVSINILIKTGRKKKNELAQVYHYDCYGKRDKKYSFLWKNNLADIKFVKLPNKAPMYFMVPKDFEVQEEYNKGFSINNLFPLNNVGVVTSRDGFVIDDNKSVLENRIKSFFELDKETILKSFDLRENKRWKIDEVKTKAEEFSKGKIKSISYRPFDFKFIYYDDDFLERSRREIMKYFFNGDNIALVTARSNKSKTCDHFYLTNKIMETKCGERTTQSSLFPLYIYPDENDPQDIFKTTDGRIKERIPNLDMEIVKKIEEQLNLDFAPEGLDIPPEPPKEGETIEEARERMEKEGDPFFTPLDLLDYIYGVLHSPTYRETYKEFLKIDFPRVPYPDDTATFWQLVRLGGELREIHLLESSIVEDFITSYPEDGDNKVTRRLTKTSIGYEATTEATGKVWINDQQYFDNVPLTAWKFYIGGYQPAQKWLKDRRDRELSYDDILHYQKIIVALSETDRIMKEIDTIEFI